MDEYRGARLVQALIESHPDGVDAGARLYQTSASFHVSIKGLAALIPDLIEVFVKSADKNEALIRAAMAASRTRTTGMNG